MEHVWYNVGGPFGASRLKRYNLRVKFIRLRNDFVTALKPKIASLTPIVLPDQRRVTMALTVENLPTLTANVTLNIPGEADSAIEPQPHTPPLYPNVELTIINSQGRTVASAFIVEHQQEAVELTLHLRQPDLNERYIARAEMTYQEERLDVVEIPFTLTEAA